MVQKITPEFNADWPQREEPEPGQGVDPNQLAEWILQTVCQAVDAQLFPIRANIDRLYALLKKVTPEKRLLAAVDELNAEAAAAAQQQQNTGDPRVEQMAGQIASLFQAVEDLGKKLPQVIEDAAARTVQRHLGEQSDTKRPSVRPDFEDPEGTGLDMDTGEE